MKTKKNRRKTKEENEEKEDKKKKKKKNNKQKNKKKKKRKNNKKNKTNRNSNISSNKENKEQQKQHKYKNASAIHKLSLSSSLSDKLWFVLGGCTDATTLRCVRAICPQILTPTPTMSASGRHLDGPILQAILGDDFPCLARTHPSPLLQSDSLGFQSLEHPCPSRTRCLRYLLKDFAYLAGTDLEGRYGNSRSKGCTKLQSLPGYVGSPPVLISRMYSLRHTPHHPKSRSDRGAHFS